MHFNNFLSNKTRNYSFSKSKIDNLNSIPFTKDDYKILESPITFRETLLKLINNAKSRICINALYLQHDEAGIEILNAIAQAIKNNPNLYVRIYVDFHRAQRGLCGKGPQIGNNVWYQQFAKENNLSLNIFGVPVKKREIFGVLHLKGFVIDNTVLYSGASINNVYLQKFDRYRIDRYHLINSKKLADCMCDYCTTAFHETNAVQDLCKVDVPKAKELYKDIAQQKKILMKQQYVFHGSPLKSNHLSLTPLVGLGKKKNNLNKTILQLINIAKTNVVIHTPYFNLPSPMLKAVNKALQRGVNISLIVGDKTANDFYIKPNEDFNKVGGVPYLYELNLKKFINDHQTYINKGQLIINLWKDNDNTFHVKGLEVDSTYILITGNNFNPRAWGLDLENGVLIYDKDQKLKDQLISERQFLLKNTTVIKNSNELESFENYPLPVQKLLKKVKNFRVQWLLKKLL